MVDHHKTVLWININNSEHDQEIPQSQTADKPVAPRGRVTQQSRDTRKTNKARQPALISSRTFYRIIKLDVILYVKRFHDPNNGVTLT